VSFGMPVWETVIAVTLSFWLALVACRVMGETDPRQQVLVQFSGIFVGTVVSVLTFAVLVPDAQVLGTDQFPAPAAQTWPRSDCGRLGCDTAKPPSRTSITARRGGSTKHCSSSWRPAAGERITRQAGGDAVRLFTRRGYDWSDRYPAIASAAAKLRAKSFTIDGEAAASPGTTGILPRRETINCRHTATWTCSVNSFAIGQSM
jgi:hypothetical protein